MADFKAFECRGPDSHLLSPADFLDSLVAFRTEQVGGVGCGDDFDLAVFECAQGRDIKVVHVRVREQDEIDVGEAVEWDGRQKEALETQCQRTEAEAHAIGEDGIGQDGEAVDFEQDGRVSQPCRV